MLIPTQACADGGSASQAAAEALAAAGFSEALLVAGGYNAWRQVFSTCGRRRPAGRWMPTGKEALKSGLPIPGKAPEGISNGGGLEIRCQSPPKSGVA